MGAPITPKEDFHTVSLSGDKGQYGAPDKRFARKDGQTAPIQPNAPNDAA